MNQDRLLLDPSEGEQDGTPYVASDDSAVWPLSDDMLAVKSMLSQAGLNAEERARMPAVRRREDEGDFWHCFAGCGGESVIGFWMEC